MNILKRLKLNGKYSGGFVAGKKVLPFMSYVKEKNKSGWSDDMADALEEITKNHFIDRYNRKLAIEALSENMKKKGSSFIDFGCSSGYMLEEAKSAFPQSEIIGADYFAQGLLHCHSRIPEIPLFQIDINKCPFPDNSFDAITFLNVLEHIEDDFSALKQLFRILKPGGKIVLTVPAGENLFDIYDEVHFHYRRYDIGRLKHLMERAGFTIQSSNYFGVFIYPAFYIVKRLNQLRFGKLRFDQKKKKIFSQIRSTERSKFMEWVCGIESFLGKRIVFPFGIRISIVATKLN